MCVYVCVYVCVCISIYIYIYIYIFWGGTLRHMEIPRLEVESEL